LPAAAPGWTRGAVCYEVFVRSYYDSDGDGIGDLNGLIAKLDYINDGNPASKTDLGASCIWLMPVAASPSYHGYDVEDYDRVEPAYGTNADFKRLVGEAHRRGIAVLVDMVLNHTSDENPWFQTALRDTTSPYRRWYRFSPTPLGKGPWGEAAWHRSPVRDEYYYGVFSRDMPDLDYHTPAVREEAMHIATFWLRQMGVDGFRLDAVPYLVEEGSCLMGCAGTHRFLHEYAAHVDSVEPGAYTVGEAWGNIAALLPYYPDQLTSYFAFELADSLLSVVRTGSAAGLLPNFLRLQDTLPAYRWSPLLSNHDGTRSMTVFGGDVARAAEVGGDLGAPTRERHQPASRQGRVLRTEVDQAAVQVEERPGVPVLQRDARRHRVRLRRFPRAPGGEAHAGPGTPLHRGTEPWVRFAARHPDLLAVVDERQTG